MGKNSGNKYGQTFMAKYGGREHCGDCRGVISKGNRVRYKYPGNGVRVLCHASCEKVKAAEAKAEAEAPYSLGGGSGYGCRGWDKGDVVRKPRGERYKDYPTYLYVVDSSERYVPEDGLSFGVGDESGSVYWARCREATEEESAPLRERERKREERSAAKQRLKDLAREIQDNGEVPEGMHAPDGVVLFDTQNCYGGGSWFVIEDEHIWYVRNNGADGDDWSHNNVRTGGAGGIGWRVQRTDELARQLHELSSMLEPAEHASN